MRNAIKKRRISLWLDRKSERHIQLMAAMFFIGFMLTIAYGYYTLASWSQISQIFIGLAVLFSFLPKTWLPFIYSARKELKVLLAVAALAPFFTGLALFLNFHISIHTEIQTFKISEYIYNYNDKTIYVELENSELNKFTEIRKFNMDKNVNNPDSALYYIHTGILGIKTVHNPILISTNHD